MFTGFTLDHIDVGDVVLRVRYGGEGPPVLLLHGHPRTHVTWHAVAERLAPFHTVVCPDMRGYGGSGKPEPAPDHSPHSKRAVAADCAALMDLLGHERFAVVGHDRGGQAALRLALDRPERVAALALGDTVPITEHLRRCDETFARAWWHWFFYAQPDKPEQAILADPAAWYGGSPEHMGPEAWQDFQAAIHDPETVRGMLEDYRAGLTVDRAHQDADRAAGRRVGCPLLVMWSTEDDLLELYPDLDAIWREWSLGEPRLTPIHSGHHMAEEAPGELAGALRAFFTEVGWA